MEQVINRKEVHFKCPGLMYKPSVTFPLDGKTNKTLVRIRIIF